MQALGIWLMAVILAAGAESPEAVRVTGIKAVHRNGQTFVTWKDAAEGEAGAKFRYSLYRSDQPITPANLAQAELCYPGVVNNSAKQLGNAFNAKDRLDPAKPTFVIEEGGTPLPMWSGLAVRTALKEGKSYYAVVATDPKYQPVGAIVPGESATTEAVEEKVAPIRPIKIGDSKTRGQWAKSSSITGTTNLPLHLSLHGSQSTGGAAGDHGDLYIYFGTPEMGWRDGLPGIFSLTEGRGKTENRLILFVRDAIENLNGDRAIETCWFGYYCVPQGATHKEPRAYPFTENRLAWIIDWVVKTYKADPLRIYSGGQSMGGMGSTQFAFRHPEIFAAVYPRLGRVRQSWLPAVGLALPSSIHKSSWKKPAPMADGNTDYFQDHMDSIKFVKAHPEDLPFYAFSFGRQDTVDTWQGNIEMVNALTAGHHGFAFAWKNCGHSSEIGPAAELLNKYYGSEKFARNRSYPAFGNSSINSNMGNGDKDDGDLEGGVNLGFIWSGVADEPDRWSVKVSNDLAKATMTVDVTPRNCQKFKAKAGEKLKWTTSAGASGETTADPWGLVTVEKVVVKPGEATVLTVSR